MSSKLLPNILLGAAAGIVAGAAIAKAQERAAKGEPAIPSALLASVGGLLPLVKAGAQRVVDTISVMEGAPGPEDGGDHFHQDEAGADLGTAGHPEQTSTSSPEQTSTSSPEQTSTANLTNLAQGHPAGPGFAPTPD